MLLVNPRREGTHQAAPSPVQVSSGGVPSTPDTTGCPRTTTFAIVVVGPAHLLPPFFHLQSVER
jgi:hypothetical protein